jgi:oligosaccharide translocation protein RFT1
VPKSNLSLGSLIARIVFQPIEETLRVFFSKSLDIPSRSSMNPNTHEGLHQVATALVSLLSVQAAFSVFLVVFGTAYIPVLVHVLLPQQYLSTSAPSVLCAWVWYIPVLAFNGGLEAFVSSVATPQDLNEQSRCVDAIHQILFRHADFRAAGWQFSPRHTFWAQLPYMACN